MIAQIKLTLLPEMNKYLILLLIYFPFILCLKRKEFVDYAIKQYSRVVKTAIPGVDYLVQGSPLDDKWLTTTNTTGHALFQAGMYAGDLWQLYAYTGNHSWKEWAIKATDGEYPMQFQTWTHDIGFCIDNSYGLGYDLTGNKSYTGVIVNAAKHMATRFSGRVIFVGC